MKEYIDKIICGDALEAMAGMEPIKLMSYLIAIGSRLGDLYAKCYCLCL